MFNQSGLSGMVSRLRGSMRWTRKVSNRSAPIAHKASHGIDLVPRISDSVRSERAYGVEYAVMGTL